MNRWRCAIRELERLDAGRSLSRDFDRDSDQDSDRDSDRIVRHAEHIYYQAIAHLSRSMGIVV